MTIRQTTILLSILLAASCAREMTPSMEPQAEESSIPVKTDNLLVEFSDEVSSQIETGQASFFPEGIISAERLFPDAGEWESRHRAAGLHRWYRVEYDSSVIPATKAVSDILEIPGALKAEKERRIKTTSYFNDPYAPQQWAWFNDGSKGNSYAAGADINVESVWQNYSTGSSKVIVAVIDSGIDMDHEDLNGVIIPAGPNGSKCFVEGRTGYYIYPDDHGTHVAGTIAAINNNGIGVSSIAGGSDGNGGVRILACQFLHTDESDPDKTLQGNAANAMVWAADHGAVISQNSWGDVYEKESDAAAGGISSTMATAIDYFIDYAGCDNNGRQRADSPMKGGVVFFAAGNDNWRYGWPAMYEKVIAVGAMTSNLSRSKFSNYGDWVDIAAPGSNIVSTTDNNTYASYDGTSMACPHASGVAALIVSYFGGPGFTNEMLKERLFGGVSDKLSLGYQIGPLVSALGSFTYGGSTAPEAPVIQDITAKSNRAVFSWAVTADADDGKAYATLLMLSKNASDLADVKNLPENVIFVTCPTGSAAAGDILTYTIDGLEFDTKYYAAIAAYDIAGNYSAVSSTKSVNIPSNNPPAISTDYTGDFNIHTYEIRNVKYAISDPDGHKFTVSFEPGSSAMEAAVTDTSCTLRIVAKNAKPGNYEAVLTAIDEYSASTVKKIPYTILENVAPEVILDPEDMILDAPGQKLTLDMTKFISDADGETLKYVVTMTEKNIVHLNPDGNTLIVTALGYGMTSISIEATDSMGEKCSVAFRVLVQDGSVPVGIYPNPVKTVLNIRVSEESVVTVKISNKAGAVVFSADGVQIDPFNPYSVNMKDLPGGIYNVSIKGSGKDENFNIAKL